MRSRSSATGQIPGDVMSYWVLSLDEIPLRDPEEVLEQRRIPVLQVVKPRRAAEENPRTLAEASRADDDGALAVYVDQHSSEEDLNRSRGMTAVLREICYDSAALFAVDCHAWRGRDQIGRCFHLYSYAEARRLLIAFIDFGGMWLDRS